MKDRDYRRLAIEISYIALVSIGCSLLILLFSPIWESSNTRMIIHAVLAFTVIIAAAGAVEDARETPNTKHLLFIAGLIYFAFVHLGTSVTYLLGILDPLSAPIEMRGAISLLELCLFCMLLMGSTSSNEALQEPLSGGRLYITASFLVLAPLVLYGGAYLFLLQSDLPFIHQLIGGFSTFIIIVALGVVVYRVAAQRQSPTDKISIRFIRGSLLLLLSFVSLGLQFFLPLNVLRVLSLLIQIWAFVFINRALIYRVLPLDDVPFQPARRFMSYVPAFLSFPVIITIYAEMFTSSIPLENPSIHFLIHFEGALLSGVFFILLYEYSRRRGEWSNFPFMFALSSWSFTELAEAFFSIYSLPHIMLDLICGLAMLTWLFIAIAWTSRPSGQIRMRDFWALFILHTILIILGVIVAILTSPPIPSLIPPIITGVGFRIGLLLVCFCGMFLVAGLLIFVIRKTRGLLSIEVLSISIIAIWLSANILRTNYEVFTFAWWAAEFVTLIGLIFGPVMLGLTTFVLISRAETLQQRSELYSDILVHDLRNYHQIIHSSLELLALPRRSKRDTSEALSMASSGLEKAVRLIHQVRSITKATELNPEKFGKINLVSIIQEAWNHILSTSPTLDCQFTFEPEQNTYYVRANKLLLDVFLNLFNNAIDYSPRDQTRIKVTITPKREQKRDWWETRVIDWGFGIPAAQKAQLFKRYTESAKGIGLGLSVALALTKAFGGTIIAEDRIPGDHSKGTIFIVSLPSLKE
jgi:signal transduction histidine kinase